MIGKFAADEEFLDELFFDFDLMRDVALGGNGLSLQSACASLKEGELFEVFVELVAQGDLDLGAVAIADVNLHLTVRINAPLVSQGGHFDVLQEPGVSASFVLCVDLLNFREADRAVFLLRASESISWLVARVVVQQGGAEVERAVIPFQGVELCLEAVDLIDDGLSLIKHLDWPWEVERLD